MQEQQTPGSYGAVDLSGGAAAPVSVGIEAPLVAPLSEANFEEQMALSQTVPVVLLFVAPGSLPSNQAQTRLEQAARSRSGAFVVRTVDVQVEQGIAAALQIQNIPTALALVARRPVPLFEGAPTEEQISSLTGQLLEAASQLGVTGRVQVSAEELEDKEPESHAAPRAAEDEGNWEQAIALWKKVLANDPADSEAKLALTRAEFELRQETQENTEGPLSAADSAFAAGQEQEAYDILLDLVQDSADPEVKEQARERLVQLFALGMDKDATKRARQRLAGLLF